jgi:hypothetical protein
VEQLAVAPVLGQGLAPVTLGGVDANQGSLGALAQRLHPDRRQSRLNRQGEIAQLRQALRQRLQGMQAQLVPAVMLEQQPLVESVG